MHGTDAVVPVEQRDELLCVVRGEAEYHPRLSPGLLERISHVAGNRRHRIRRHAVHYSPALPRPLERGRGLLGLEHQFRLAHGDPLLIATARSRPSARPPRPRPLPPAPPPAPPPQL